MFVDGGTTKDTVREVWEVLARSFYHLWLGTWPDRDWRGAAWAPGSAEDILSGQPLADGHFGVIWLLKGDLDYFAKQLGLRHYGANAPCDF